MPNSPKDLIERYLRTGEHDALFSAWPGESVTVRLHQGDLALRGALISVVKSRAGHATVPKELVELDVASFTRSKVEPMVRGLFPAAEQQAVLDLLAHSVVFLTPATIEPALNQARYLRTAWSLSNIYLASCGSKLMTNDAPELVGLSEETTCYVSTAYFGSNGQFDDFIVHEAAHIFHNCKRQTIGLPEVGGREWLLNVDFGKRETFAYACEVYSRQTSEGQSWTPIPRSGGQYCTPKHSRLLEVGTSPAARRKLLSQIENGPGPPDERVDASEYIDTIRAAVAARNGWKKILENCDEPFRRSAQDDDLRSTTIDGAIRWRYSKDCIST